MTGNFVSQIMFSGCGSTNGVYPTSISFGGSSGSCSFPGNSGVYFKVNVPSAQTVTINPNIQSSASCQTAVHTGDGGSGTPFIWENDAPWQVTFSAQQGTYTILLICWQGGNYNLQVTGSGGGSPPQQQPPATGHDETVGQTTNTFASSSGGSVPAAMADRSSSTWVQGGLASPGGDYQGSYTVKLGDPQTCTFYAQVECISGSCGDHNGCGYYFKIKNPNTGQWVDMDNMWVGPGISTKPSISLANPNQYTDASGYAEIMFSMECNMNGKVLDFDPACTYAQAPPQQPSGYCSDSICDTSIGETCSTCPFDCGNCDVPKKQNGIACIIDNDCNSNHCVHDVCRSSDIHCGDNYCDSGENCGDCYGDCQCTGGKMCISNECKFPEAKDEAAEEIEKIEYEEPLEKNLNYKYYKRTGVFTTSLEEVGANGFDVFKVNYVGGEYDWRSSDINVKIESKMDHSWYWIYVARDTGSGYANPEYYTFLPPGQERSLDIPVEFYMVGGNEINIPRVKAEYACSLNAIDSILATAPGSPFDGLPPDLLTLFSESTGTTTSIDAGTFFGWIADNPGKVADALGLDEAAVKNVAGKALKILKLWDLLDKLGENIWAPVQEELYVQVMAQ